MAKVDALFVGYGGKGKGRKLGRGGERGGGGGGGVIMEGKSMQKKNKGETVEKN